MAQPIWHGTEEEGRILINVLRRNCICDHDANGAITTSCESHKLFVSSQRFLDGLLYGRRVSERLINEEWLEPLYSGKDSAI